MFAPIMIIYLVDLLDLVRKMLVDYSDSVVNPCQPCNMSIIGPPMNAALFNNIFLPPARKYKLVNRSI